MDVQDSELYISQSLLKNKPTHTLRAEFAHLYLVRFMADVLQQQLHTAVITVSYKHVVLFICIPVSWRDKTH